MSHYFLSYLFTENLSTYVNDDPYFKTLKEFYVPKIIVFVSKLPFFRIF